MVETLEIRRFKSQLPWKGKYFPSKRLILIREGLSREEETETLRHEFAHYWFYERSLMGRFLRIFYGRNVGSAYAVVLALTWIFSPLFYMIALVPFALDNAHECVTSLRYPSKLSFAVAFIMMVGTYALFWIRTAVSLSG